MSDYYVPAVVLELNVAIAIWHAYPQMLSIVNEWYPMKLMLQ